MLIAHAHILYSSVFFQFRSENCAKANLQIYCTLRRYVILRFVAQTEDLRLAHVQQNPRIVQIRTLTLAYTSRIEVNC